MTEKTCSRCHQAKPLGDFKTDTRKPNGKASSCKACNLGVGFAVARTDLAGLTPYDQARRLLVEAKTVDDVKTILDRACALKEYARRAKDRSMEIDAAEIRFYSERRFGEMIARQKEEIGLHKGGRPPERTDPKKVSVSPIRLEDIGITSNFSSHAQKMAAVPQAEFDARIGAWREEAQAAKTRVTVDLLKMGEAEQQRNARRDLAQALSDGALEYTGTRQYACIYFDPPWRRKQGLTDRSYENHYPTMTWPEIIEWATSMRARLLPDAWGFMWIPRAHLLALHPVEYTIQSDDGSIHKVNVPTPLSWAVARAMGFDAYSTCFVWTKTDEEHPDDIGSGILVRDQDEILLMFKKGRGLPKPTSSEIFGSNHRERSRPLGHSRKPQFYREMIARMVGTDMQGKPLSVLECFARHDEQFPLPENWDSIGNEAQPAASREAAE